MESRFDPSAFGLLGIIFLIVMSNTVLLAYAQQQNGTSTVSSICKMVQDNRFLAGVAGLDQAVSICNNLSTMNSSQVLSQLCSVVGGLKIINVESICKQQQAPTQNQTAPQDNSVKNNNASNSTGSSNSLMDKTIGILRGYLSK